MPPVINTPDKRQTDGGGDGSAPNSASSQNRSHQRHGERRADLLCRVKWNNSLPDIPFDPKFIVYPFDSDRFTKYKPTSLEKEYKHELLTEYDLGVMIDLINPDKYAAPPEHLNVLDPADERLIEDESGTSGLNSSGISGINEKRSKQHNKVVPWLKKTEYISTEFNRYGAAAEHSETKVGYNVSKKYKDDKEKILSMNRDEQIEAINRTFQEAKVDIPTTHPTKKDVTPVAIYPVFPDFESWKMPFAQVAFDAEPVVDGDPAKQEILMSEAIIRGVMDESGEQFVAYFLPTEETLEKRKRDLENNQEYDPNDEYEYKMAREYTWSIKNKATRGYDQNYFFILRDGCYYYNELETKVKLTKRRSKNSNSTISKLVVKHRPLDESEMKTQEHRENQLMPNVEEDDDEEEMVVEEKKKDVSSPKQKDNDDAKKKSEPSSSEDDDETVKEKKKDKESKKKDKESKKRKRKDSSSSESQSSSSSESSSGSGSDSESSKKASSSDEEDEEDQKAKKVKKIADDIFGSGSDDDSS